MTESKKSVLERSVSFGRKKYKLMSVGEDFVSLADSVKIVGTNKSGKTYVNFRTERVRIYKLSENADGTPRVNVYAKRRVGPRARSRMSSVVNETPVLSTPYNHADFSIYDSVAIGEFMKLYSRRYGEVTEYPTPLGLARLAYPMLAQRESWSYAPTMGGPLRKSDPRSFLDSAFGKTRYRRDLLKAVAESHSMIHVATARQFRGLVPVDWIVDALGQWSHQGESVLARGERTDIEAIRRIAQWVDLGSRKRLMRDLFLDSTPDFAVTDSIRSAKTLAGHGLFELGKVKNWSELHDVLAVKSRTAGKINRPIPQKHKYLKAIDGTTVGNWSIHSAKDTHTLEAWGGQMSNCIGSYSGSAISQRTLLFGVFEDEKLVGNVEVSTEGRVVQLVGRFNGRLEGGDVIVERIHKLTGNAKLGSKIAVQWGGF